MPKAKRVVITGVTRGLGRAMVGEFIRHGHVVAGCARSARAIEELRTSHPLPCCFDVVDVTSDGAVAAWAKRVVDAVGPPDLLLNNAGLINRNAALWEVPTEEFRAVIDANINGVANVIRRFAPAMMARGHGVIVNFSSGWGRGTDPQVAPYCATKWAIEGMTRALAQELPPGMAAIPLNPGIIDTEMLRSCFGAEAADYPSAQEWAEKAVPFLLKLGARDNGRALTVG